MQSFVIITHTWFYSFSVTLSHKVKIPYLFKFKIKIFLHHKACLVFYIECNHFFLLLNNLSTCFYNNMKLQLFFMNKNILNNLKLTTCDSFVLFVTSNLFNLFVLIVHLFIYYIIFHFRLLCDLLTLTFLIILFCFFNFRSI